MGGSVSKSSDSFNIHEGLVYEQPISIDAKHACVVSILYHSFDSSAWYFELDNLVNILWSEMLEELHPFQHGFRKREAVRFRRWYVKVRLGHWRLWYWVKKYALHNRNFLLAFLLHR